MNAAHSLRAAVMILAQRSQVRQASVDRADQHAYLANVWYQPNEGPTSGSLLRCSLASAVCQRSETAFECLVSAADQQGWGKQHQHQGTRAHRACKEPPGACAAPRLSYKSDYVIGQCCIQNMQLCVPCSCKRFPKWLFGTSHLIQHGDQQQIAAVNID
jgi:hypothetical protein